MAAIEELIRSVADTRLRDALAAAVAHLKAAKKFGLVFEEHLPETVLLPGLAIKVGARVMLKNDPHNLAFRVIEEVNGKRVKVIPDHVTKSGVIRGLPQSIVNSAMVMNRSDLVVAKAFGEPMYPALIPVDAVERAPGKPWHVLINADNYHALQLLQYGYIGKVDVIYIDPPYNSGARDWKYNNDYVDATDLVRHSKWLAMMQRRLLLAKQLLNPSGSVLIVTIDEKEYLRLGLLLEDLFPDAVIQMISTVIKPEGTGRVNEFSRTNEFVYFVAIGDVGISATTDNMYDNDGSRGGQGVEWRDLRRRERSSVRGSRANQFYAVFVYEKNGHIHSVGDALPDDIDRETIKPPRGTRAVFPLTPQGKEMVWSKRPSSFRDLVKAGYARTNGETIQYLSSGTVAAIENGEATVSGRDEQGAVIAEFPVARNVMPKTVWTRDSHNPQTFGTKLLSAILPDRNFPFPKSLYAVEDSIRFFVKDKPQAIILDFFAGSGTTMHAVARLNKQDGGTRRSITVTNNEVSPSEAATLSARGLQPGDLKWEALGVCEHITWPRLKCAITGTSPDGHPIQGMYKFADEFPMSDGFVENAV